MVFNTVLRKFVLGSMCAATFAFSASAANADTVVYSNLNTSLHSGLTPYAAGTSGGVNYTSILGDDIDVAAGTDGTKIDKIAFSLVNYNTFAVTFTPYVEIFNDDGGFPGNLLYEYAPGTITAAAGPAGGGASLGTVTISTTGTLFTAPSSTFWIGVIFSDAGTAGLDPSVLQNLGLGLFDPPTAGSTSSYVYYGLSADSPGQDYPNGTPLEIGPPDANFGFALYGPSTGVAATPEPSSLSLLAIGITSLGGIVKRARRKA